MQVRELEQRAAAANEESNAARLALRQNNFVLTQVEAQCACTLDVLVPELLAAEAQILELSQSIGVARKERADAAVVSSALMAELEAARRRAGPFSASASSNALALMAELEPAPSTAAEDAARGRTGARDAVVEQCLLAELSVCDDSLNELESELTACVTTMARADEQIAGEAKRNGEKDSMRVEVSQMHECDPRPTPRANAVLAEHNSGGGDAPRARCDAAGAG